MSRKPNARLLRFVGVLICALLLVSNVVAWDQPRRAQIDAIFAAVTSKGEPGMAVLVRRNGRTVFERGYGMRDLRSGRTVRTDTNFRLASMSKQFTAMAAMLLIHDGKLRYDDRLSRVLPGFPSYGDAITIRMLLNHTAGIRSHEEWMVKEYASRPPSEIPQITDAQVLRFAEQQTTTKFAPGTQWDYSNTGYIILGQIVEKVSGMRFGEFLQKRIFGPLKMRDTIAFEAETNKVRNRAYGYTKVGNTWMETDQNSTSGTLGDGGVYSSIHDLIKWDDALRRNSLLSVSEFRPAVTPVLLPDPDRLPNGPDGMPLAYGFGWRLDQYQGHRTMSHRGGSIGFRTDIERFPDDNLTIIVLCNRTDLDARDLAHRVANLYLK